MILMTGVMIVVKSRRLEYVVHKIVLSSMILIIAEIVSPVDRQVCVVVEPFLVLPMIPEPIAGRGPVQAPMVLLMTTVALLKNTVEIVLHRLDKVSNVMIEQMETTMMAVMIVVKQRKWASVVVSVEQLSMIFRIVEIVLIVEVQTSVLLVQSITSSMIQERISGIGSVVDSMVPTMRSVMLPKNDVVIVSPMVVSSVMMAKMVMTMMDVMICVK